MFSNNKYNFLKRPLGEKNPFMGLFDHDGFRRSSGVRPVRDDLKEASPMIPDTSNFESEEFIEPEVEDVGMDDNIPQFNVEPVSLDSTPAGESKGLKIGDEVKKDKGLKVRPANVSRETKEAQNDPYLHDLDDESQYARQHPSDYINDPAFPIMDARAQLLDLDIDSKIKDYLLGCLNDYPGKTSQAGSGVDSVTWRSKKEGKLDEKEKKDLKNYWQEVYPKDYSKKMVEDYEVEGKDEKSKSKKK